MADVTPRELASISRVLEVLNQERYMLDFDNFEVTDIDGDVIGTVTNDTNGSDYFLHI